MLDEKSRAAWPFAFGLVFSVVLGRESLGMSMQVRNLAEDEGKAFDFQALFHSYLRVEVCFLTLYGGDRILMRSQDVTKSTITSLNSNPVIDKLNLPASLTPITSLPTEKTSTLTLTATTDRVYPHRKTSVPVVVSKPSSSTPKFAVSTEGLPDVVVWNPWSDGATKIGDFGPAEGWRNMLCIEPGHVYGWVTLEAGDAWEGGQVIRVGGEAERVAKL